jgi:hypothetical protein
MDAIVRRWDSPNHDAVVCELDQTSRRCAFVATIFGGSLDDEGVAIAVDPARNPVVA